MSLFSAPPARRTHWAAARNSGMSCGLRGLAPLASLPHEARRGLCPPPEDPLRFRSAPRDCLGLRASPRRGLPAGDLVAAPTPQPSWNRHPWEEVGVSPPHKLGPGAPDRAVLARAPFLQATLELRAGRPPTASTSARAPLSVFRRAGKRCRASQSHQFAPLKPRRLAWQPSRRVLASRRLRPRVCVQCEAHTPPTAVQHA